MGLLLVRTIIEALNRADRKPEEKGKRARQSGAAVMSGTAAVITGASRGIGLALTRARLSRSRQQGNDGSPRLEKLFAVCRNPTPELLGLAASTPRIEIVSGSLTSATGPAELASQIQRGCAAEGLLLSELYNVAGSAVNTHLSVEVQQDAQPHDSLLQPGCLLIPVLHTYRIRKSPAKTRACGSWLPIAAVLHEPNLGVEPERRLEDMANLDGMLNTFAINSFAPIRLIGALAPQLCAHNQMVRVASWSGECSAMERLLLGLAAVVYKGKACLEAAVAGDLLWGSSYTTSCHPACTARVGSITDNRLGGWYSYRASKAAQNSFTKSAAIELQRRKQRKGGAAVVAVHPGTVCAALTEDGVANWYASLLARDKTPVLALQNSTGKLTDNQMKKVI
eukprot:1161523-Pelagomonas_calceolata.AAC.4